MRKIYFVVLLFVLPIVAAAQFDVPADGTWNNPATWPTSAIANGPNDNVTVDDPATLTLGTGDTKTSGSLFLDLNTILVVKGAGTLNVGNAGTPQTLTASGNTEIDVKAGGVLTIWGDLDDTNTHLRLVIDPGGTLEVKGNVNLDAFSGIIVSGDLVVDGAFTASHDTNITVDSAASVSVYGPTTVGIHSNVIGGGNFHTYGGCSGPPTFCSTAPVQLTAFRADAEASSVALSWTTASEINFDYFRVEKSSDGEVFTEISTVAGKGSTRGRTDYALVDEKPYEGKSYYRLTEVDLDQSVHHLKTVAVVYTGARSLSIFPNPVTNSQVNFQLNFVPENSVQVSIVDLRGVTMSSFEIKEQTVQLPVQLTAGVYIVTMRSDNLKTVSKLIVK